MNLLKTITLTLAMTLPMMASTVDASTNLPPFDAPGIGAASYPNFLDTNGNITMKKMRADGESYWQLSGKGSATSLWGADSSYNVKNEKFKYVANFDSNGNLITSIGSKNLDNYLEIRGSLPAGQIGNTSWDKIRNPNTLLLKADLTDFGIDLANSALGFKTLFTGGWAPSQPGLTGGSIGENLWLFSDEEDNDRFMNLIYALDGIQGNGTLDSLIGKNKTIKHVSAIASVPVPGAVWLFGTGLAGLLAARRKHANLKMAA